MRKKYHSFCELPDSLRARIEMLAGPKNPNDWINEAVHALKGSSILEILNTENGEKIIDEHLTKIEGYLGG